MWVIRYHQGIIDLRCCRKMVYVRSCPAVGQYRLENKNNYSLLSSSENVIISSDGSVRGSSSVVISLVSPSMELNGNWSWNITFSVDGFKSEITFPGRVKRFILLYGISLTRADPFPILHDDHHQRKLNKKISVFILHRIGLGN